MSPFIHSAFWSDPEIEVVSSDAKLAVLWIITNGQTSIIGLCNATEKRFAFETGLAPSVLQDACNALPNMLLQTTDGIWVRNYIHHQFGRGEKLSRNNCYRAIGNAVSQLQDQALILAIYTHYPEMEGVCKPLLRASVPLTKGPRREEKGTEVNGLDSEKGEQGETEKPPAEQVPYEKIREKFHALCPSLPKLRDMTDERKCVIKTKWRACNGTAMEQFEELFTLAEASDFLTGREGVFKIGFDWLLKPRNAQKVLEGNYVNKRNGHASATATHARTTPATPTIDPALFSAWVHAKYPHMRITAAVAQTDRTYTAEYHAETHAQHPVS